MVVRLTNKEPEKAIIFIDSTSRHLRLLTCAIYKGKDHLDDLKLKVILHEKHERRYYLAGTLSMSEFEPSPKFNEELYLNKKYKITSKYERISFSMDTECLFDIELKFIID